MAAYIIDILLSLVALLIGWNIYLFKTIHAARTDLYTYKLSIAQNYLEKHDVEKIVKDIADRQEGMEERIESRIVFLIKNGGRNGGYSKGRNNHNDC